jgi:hypothetical protein
MYPYRPRKTPTNAPLALGDLIVVAGLVTAGTFHHGGTDPLHVVSVALPFVVGWFVVAPIAGAYGRYPSTRNELFATLGTWTVAAPVGLGIRSTTFFPGNSPPSFGFVMIALGGFTVVLWRLVVARLAVRVVGVLR